MTYQPSSIDQQPGQAAPGWYAIDPGHQQYWDGTNWVGSPQPGQPFQSYSYQEALINGTTSDERTLALLTHLMIFIVSGLGPLIVYFIKKDQSKFVRHHAAEALNLFIMTFVVLLALFSIGGIFLLLGTVSEVFFSFGLVLISFGYFAFIGFTIFGAVMAVVAAVKANKGEYYRIPFVLHLVK